MLQNAWIAATTGVAVATASAAIAWAGLRWSMRQPGTMMVAILGGTMIRLLLVAGVSIVLLLFNDVHTAGYASGLLGAYLLFLGVEIVFVARSAGRGDVDKRDG